MCKLQLVSFYHMQCKNLFTQNIRVGIISKTRLLASCHSLFIHNPATALEPNMIKQAKHKTDTQTWHKEHDPEHHGERRIESSSSRIVPVAEHGPAAARTAAAFWQHQQCAAAEIIGQMVQDPIRQPATKAIPAGDAKSSHFEIISVSTGDKRKLEGIYDRHVQFECVIRGKFGVPGGFFRPNKVSW
jgi:hypothetical protein